MFAQERGMTRKKSPSGQGGGNQTFGRAEAKHLDHYERLPSRFKKLLQDSAVDLRVKWILDLIAEKGEDRAYEAVEWQIAYSRAKAAFDTYGPDHPDARPHIEFRAAISATLPMKLEKTNGRLPKGAVRWVSPRNRPKRKP